MRWDGRAVDKALSREVVQVSRKPLKFGHCSDDKRMSQRLADVERTTRPSQFACLGMRAGDDSKYLGTRAKPALQWLRS